MNVLGMFFVLVTGIGDSLGVRAAWISSSLLREVLPAPGALRVSLSSELPPETGKDSKENEWVPEQSLTLEHDPSRILREDGTSVRIPSVLGDFGDGERGSSSLSESGALRPLSGLSHESVLKSRAIDPLDSPCNFQNLRASREKGMARGSIGPSLPEWINSSGISFGSHSILAVNFDMLGFEDTDPDRGLIPDALHASPKFNNLATSVGISLKF
jgi:hypothetical protein